jgi:glycerol-3-phosphate dehydrogenase
VTLREHLIDSLPERDWDVLVIGGGINGAVSAAALAARGAAVALVERCDFASFTSQQSSNLAWGGIKYLESWEFALVHQLCRSRNRLIREYPSTVREIRFLTTVRKGFRHRPLVLWLGAWLYWFIGHGFTDTPRLLSPRAIRRASAVIDVSESVGGIEYSDAFFHDNDARFVFGFVRTAIDHGCSALNYVEMLDARRDGERWLTRVRDRVSGRAFTVRSRLVVNAAGAFVEDLNRNSGVTTAHRHVFSKGVHLIVERISPERRVLAFFADDGRLFFAIPMGSKTCIGTTDTPVADPHTQVTDEDRRFVLDNINRCLRLDRPLTVADIIAERCGVRPLAVQGVEDDRRDFLQLSRRHAIDVDAPKRHLSIFGGKLTDCINVGDEVCHWAARLGLRLGNRDAKWYGEPPAEVRARFLRECAGMRLDAIVPGTTSELPSERLWRRYGLAAFELLEAIRHDPRQAERLIEGCEYLRCEIRQAARREMVVTLEDFLRRRSKIAQVVSFDAIRNAAGLMEACRLLFGDSATERYREYVDNRDGSRAADALSGAMS